MRVCQYCGKEINKYGSAPTCHECSMLYQKLISKNNSEIKREKKSKHTPEELEAIKKKYASGVPVREIELMVKGFVS